MVRATLPEKPEMSVTVRVIGLLVVAWLTLMLDGDADSEKSGGRLTVTLALPVILPEAADTVALPMEAPAVKRPLVASIAPSPVAVQVKLGCVASGAPF